MTIRNFVGKTLLLSMLAISVAGTASAGKTPWFDWDDISGSGDWETTNDILTPQCRIKGTKQSVKTNVPSKGYYKNNTAGCWCKNAEVPNGKCKDIEIRCKYWSELEIAFADFRSKYLLCIARQKRFESYSFTVPIQCWGGFFLMKVDRQIFFP